MTESTILFYDIRSTEFVVFKQYKDLRSSDSNRTVILTQNPSREKKTQERHRSTPPLSLLREKNVPVIGVVPPRREYWGRFRLMVGFQGRFMIVQPQC